MIKGVQYFGGELSVISQEVLIVSSPSGQVVVSWLGSSGSGMRDEYVLPVFLEGGQNFLCGFVYVIVEFKCNGERRYSEG